MKYDLEYLLNEYRKYEKELFDEDGNLYSSLKYGDHGIIMKIMKELINKLIDEIIKIEKSCTKSSKI